MKKEITETIEFFIPSQGLDVRAYIDQPNPPEINTKAGRLRKQAIHHLGRYEWAALVLSNMNPGRILDVACGAGYGSYLLARSLPECQVVGGDYDIRAVEHATENYGHLPTSPSGNSTLSRGRKEATAHPSLHSIISSVSTLLNIFSIAKSR